MACVQEETRKNYTFLGVNEFHALQGARLPCGLWLAMRFTTCTNTHLPADLVTVFVWSSKPARQEGCLTLQRVPIEFKVPASTAAETSVDARLAQNGAGNAAAAPRDGADPSRTGQAAAAGAKPAQHAQRESRGEDERDRSKTRESARSEGLDAKHAERDSRAGRSMDPAARHAQHGSKYEADRAKRDAERSRDQRSSKDDTRLRDPLQERRHGTTPRRQSLTRLGFTLLWLGCKSI